MRRLVVGLSAVLLSISMSGAALAAPAAELTVEQKREMEREKRQEARAERAQTMPSTSKNSGLKVRVPKVSSGSKDRDASWLKSDSSWLTQKERTTK